MMILLVGLEVLRQLQNSPAENGYLYLGRPGVRLMDPKLRNYVNLFRARQCHSSIDTPRLSLNRFVSVRRIAQIRRIQYWRSCMERSPPSLQAQSSRIESRELFSLTCVAMPPDGLPPHPQSSTAEEPANLLRA